MVQADSEIALAAMKTSKFEGYGGIESCRSFNVPIRRLKNFARAQYRSTATTLISQTLRHQRLCSKSCT